MSQFQAVMQLGRRLQMPKDQELLQVDGQVFRVLGQLRGHQQFYPVLADQLVARRIPPPANVGIDRYLSDRTRSR